MRIVHLLTTLFFILVVYIACMFSCAAIGLLLARFVASSNMYVKHADNAEKALSAITRLQLLQKILNLLALFDWNDVNNTQPQDDGTGHLSIVEKEPCLSANKVIA